MKQCACASQSGLVGVAWAWPSCEKDEAMELTTFEHATLKVPYELLNRRFRAAQKTVDRELNQVSVGCADVSSVLESATQLSVAETVGALDSVSFKLATMKRKTEECVEEETECAELCKTRLEHLKSYAAEEQTDGMKAAWRQVRVDRMLIDHFLRAGYYTAAYKLCESSDIRELVDVDIFMVCQKVEDALRRHDTAPCLNWCYENRSKLRRMKSTLEFQLRLQDFIELIRLNKRAQAIKYARKHFSSSDQLLKDVQQAMGLLAFDPSTRIRRYQKLFSLSRWVGLIDQFRQENFGLYQLSQRSVLSVTLQAGLSALKTPQCYKEEEHNPQCPVCSKPFNGLAKPLPFAHCSQSYLICSLSGKPMNEHNPPMALPNGYVYGEQALVAMAAENGGQVVCPRTKESFNITDVKKVYVM